MGLILIMFLAPYGLVGLIKKTVARFLVIVPKPAGRSVAPLASEQ
jgi:hypothetical protein